MRGLPLTRGLDRLVDRPARFLVALSSINDAPCKWNSHKLAKQLANLTNNLLNPLKKLASCEKRDSPMDAKELKTAIRQLKSSCTDNQSVEVRESVGKMPSSIAETISAFVNGSGGAIALRLSEKNGFESAERFEAHRIADALSQACSDKLTPPARASIDILDTMAPTRSSPPSTRFRFATSPASSRARACTRAPSSARSTAIGN